MSRMRIGTDLNMNAFLQEGQLRNNNQIVNNLNANQLINLLNGMGVDTNEVRQDHGNRQERRQIHDIIQSIRFGLNSTGFSDANILNLEQKSVEFVEAIDVIVKSVLGLMNRVWIMPCEVSYLHT